MWQYFAPSLRSITIAGVVVDDGNLNDLRTRCGKLTCFMLEDCGKKITPDALLSFISQYTSLAHIVLNIDDPLISDALIVHLSERPGLRTLGMRKHIPTAVLETAAAGVTAPFAKLESLELTLSCSDVPLLTSWAGNITSLSLFVVGSEGDVLPHISSLRRLRSLKLGFLYPRVLSRAEIMTLRHLVNLVELYIPSRGSSLDIADEEFSHRDFDDLFSRLSHLRRLYFGVFYTMTIDTLDSLSTHCPELEELEIPVDVDKVELEKRPGVMFPNLRLVEFSAIVWFDNKRIGQDEYDKRELVLLLKRHMPKLEELALGTVRLGEEALNSDAYNIDEDGTPVSVGGAQPAS
ncbi:hypothetical protein NQ176_g6384 [Zarea fungicola]|uniref:Uncharacterized protein n=1 Tax=Zarea fungicola TaxID=93591 RepID=A0ACC1N5V5_9HYPO|nr:hypothetical protein NQ176_g6384 [Lecanicillium fungicola]